MFGGCMTIVLAAIGISYQAYLYDVQDTVSYEAWKAIIIGFVVLLLMLLVYGIVMLVFLCQDSQPDENEYGASPKYVAEDSEAAPTGEPDVKSY